MKQAAHRSLLFAALAASACMFALGGTANAQTSLPPPADPSAPKADDAASSDIIVTANRRAENLQNVGISVTALSGDQLQALGYTDVTEIAKQTPGLSIQRYHPALTIINIRGVSQNDFGDHLEPPIAVYMDDSYIGAPGAISGQIFDLERVETLRGPQGTLFGRNATGGLVHYISRGPTDTFEGYLQASYGERNLFQTEGAVSGPLGEGLRARASFATDYNDGYFRNRIGERANNANNYSGRLQIEADLGANATLLLRATGNTNKDERGPGYNWNGAVPDADGLGRPLGPNETAILPNVIVGGTITAPCPGCDLTGFKEPDNNPFTGSLDPGRFERDVYGFSGRLTWNLGTVTLTAISDYLRLEKTIDLDVDAGPSPFFTYRARADYDQFTQEVRLSQEGERFNWQAGGFYLRMRGEYLNGVDFDPGVYLGIPPCSAPACTTGRRVPADFRANYAIDVDSYAFFAQGDYALSDTLKATFGIRYTNDHKTNDYLWTNTVGAPPVAYNPSTDDSADRHFSNVSFKAQLDWTPTDDVLLYAGVSRGYKGGNWAAPVFPANAINPANFPHDQERLTSYEVGAKTRLLDRAITLNGSAFYYDYTNYQAFSLINLAQTIVNRDAVVYGGEIELRANPVENLTFSLGTSFLNTTIEDVTLPSGRVVDRDMPNAPGFSGNALIRYDIPVGAGGAMVSPQATFTYAGSRFLSSVNEPTSFDGDYLVTDLRLNIDFGDGHWTGAVWAKNVFNAKYRLYEIDISALGLAPDVFAPPRWIGATAAYRF